MRVRNNAWFTYLRARRGPKIWIGDDTYLRTNVRHACMCVYIHAIYISLYIYERKQTLKQLAGCCQGRGHTFISTSEEHHFQTSEFRGTVQMPSNSDMSLPRRMNPKRFRRCTPPELCVQYVLKYRWRSPACNFNRHRAKKLFTCLTIVRRGVVHLALSQSRLAGQDGNVKLPQSDRRNLPRADFHRVGLPSRLNWS